MNELKPLMEYMLEIRLVHKFVCVTVAEKVQLLAISLVTVMGINLVFLWVR